MHHIYNGLVNLLIIISRKCNKATKPILCSIQNWHQTMTQCWGRPSGGITAGMGLPLVGEDALQSSPEKGRLHVNILPAGLGLFYYYFFLFSFPSPTLSKRNIDMGAHTHTTWACTIV